MELFENNVRRLPIRRVYISFGGLSSTPYEQTSLFEDPKKQEDRKQLQAIVDTLKHRYGKNIILRGSSLLEDSTAKLRHSQIGGHKK